MDTVYHDKLHMFFVGMFSVGYKLSTNVFHWEAPPWARLSEIIQPRLLNNIEQQTLEPSARDINNMNI